MALHRHARKVGVSSVLLGRGWLGLPVLLVAVALAAPLAATTVKQFDFLGLQRAAGSIFHGRCVARREVQEGAAIPSTEYTFQVIQAAKGCRDARGKVVETLTFRQAGTRAGQVRADGLEVPPLPLGLPGYDVGEEVVLFLTRESRLGLCAPVGLSQGKFQVIRAGRLLLVKNRQGNRGLFDKVEAASFREVEEAELESVRSAGEGIELKQLLRLCERVKE